MKIGHYSPAIFAHGGIGRYIQRLADAQQKAGHEVYYFSRNASESSDCTVVDSEEDLYQTAVANDLDVLHLHKEVSTRPPSNLNVIRTMHGNQASCPSGSRYLSRRHRLCDRKYSKIGCLWGHVVDGCGSSKPERLKAHFNRIEKEKKVLPHIQTLTVSEFLRTNMVREGYPETKVSSLLSPAPEAGDVVPVPSDSPPRFVFLGRIVPQKGVDWLIRSIVHVTSDCVVDIAGDGYFLDGARRMAKDLGVESRLNFLGWVDADRAAEAVRASRAVIFPSVWHEPAGLVTLEAAAAARPVITAAVGGIPEYADPSFAVVLEPHDERGLAEAINRFCDDWNLADSMGKAGKQYVEANHSFDDFVARLSDHYKRLTGAN